MKYFLLLLFSLSALSSNDKAHTYASSKDCQTCHPQIYNEFSGSMHANSIPQKDPIHNAVWEKHPQNIKLKRYECGKCHTPAADNLDNMLTKGKNALPDAKNPTHQAGISCAYCHRIESITHAKKFNTNIMTKEEKKYFGTRKDHIESPYHGIITSDDDLMKSGNVCIGCHSHKKNKHGLNVCSTNIDNEMDAANCVSCHMPKVKGSVSNMKERATHTFHGFAGSHYHSEMLQQYVDISLLREINDFVVNIDNHTSHALLLHPLRVAVLKVSVVRDGKSDQLRDEQFIRLIGHEGKPAMPWKASVTLKDTMIQANEKRSVKYDYKLRESDRVEVVLGWYLVNPKVLSELGLESEAIASEFIVFKEQSFDF